MLKTARKTRDTIFYIKIITLELMMINSMLKVSHVAYKGFSSPVPLELQPVPGDKILEICIAKQFTICIVH
jgi:hypothetical protein